MSSTSISSGNTPEEDLDKEPLNNRGEPYYYCMVTPDQEKLVYADTTDDLLEVLIPGYMEADETEKVVKRIMLANVVASYIQGNLISLMEDEAEISEDEWGVLYAPKTGSTAPTPTFWNSSIPLIVIDTTYEPYTSLPRPSSAEDGVKSENLVWLRPSDPEDFVKSLSDIGHIRLMVNNDYNKN